jgi:hypothetical protein
MTVELRRKIAEPVLQLCVEEGNGDDVDDSQFVEDVAGCGTRVIRR